MLQSDEVVLHLEFQTQPKADIPFRMIDYRLRVYRRFKSKRMRQVVIYLQQTNSEITDQRIQNNIAASAFILAGLVLEKEIIQQLLRRELMQESVTYQAILAEGLAEGRAQEVRRVAMNLLKEGISVEIVAKVTGLSVEQVQQLVSEEASNAGA